MIFSSKCVVVVGMHSSGTSMLANLIQNTGFLMSKDPTWKSQKHPLGIFEDANFLKIHNLMIGDWEHPIVNHDYLEEYFSLIRSYDHGLWGVKDPRLCFLLPYFRKVKSNFKIVSIHRDISSVVSSLRERSVNRLCRAEIRDICNRYEKAKTESLKSVGVPVLEKKYERLLANPIAETKSLCEFLGIEFERSFIKCVRPDLKRH